MLRTVIFVLSIFAIGCASRPTETEARRQLSGRWLLDTKHDCNYGPVKSDELLLREDGRLEQHLILKDGRTFDSTNGHWSFIPKSNVGLESRWSFRTEAEGPVKTSESLIVEFGKTPVIVIDPDSNCFYWKM